MSKNILRVLATAFKREGERERSENFDKLDHHLTFVTSHFNVISFIALFPFVKKYNKKK
jgi:hypothetical protein